MDCCKGTLLTSTSQPRSLARLAWVMQRFCNSVTRVVDTVKVC